MPPPRTEDLMPLTYGKEKQKELPEYQVGDFPLRPVEKEALEVGGKPALDDIVRANLGGPLNPFQDKVVEYDRPSLVDNDFGAKPNIKPRTLTPVERPTFEEFENLVKLYYVSRGKTFKEFMENAIEPHVLLESGFEPHNIHTDLRHVVRGDDPKENNEYFRLGTKMIGQFPNALQIEYGAVHWDKDPPERFYLVVQEETKPFSGGGRHKDVELELRTDKLRDRYVNFNREYHLTGNGTYYVLIAKLENSSTLRTISCAVRS